MKTIYVSFSRQVDNDSFSLYSVSDNLTDYKKVVKDDIYKFFDWVPDDTFDFYSGSVEVDDDMYDTLVMYNTEDDTDDDFSEFVDFMTDFFEQYEKTGKNYFFYNGSEYMEIMIDEINYNKKYKVKYRDQMIKDDVDLTDEDEVFDYLTKFVYETTDEVRDELLKEYIRKLKFNF